MSSFTIENLLRDPKEKRSKIEPKPEKRHNFDKNNEYRRATFLRNSTYGYRQRPFGPASFARGPISINETNDTCLACCPLIACCCAEFGRQGLKRYFMKVCSTEQRFNVHAVIRQDIECGGAFNGEANTKCGILEPSLAYETVANKRGFKCFSMQERDLNCVDKNNLRTPIAPHQERPSLVDGKNNDGSVQRQDEMRDVKYDWMVNPRPFYRKGNFVSFCFALRYSVLKICSVCFFIYKFEDSQ